MTRTSSLTTAIRTLLRTLVPVSAAGMVAFGVMTAFAPGIAQASSRIKDIVDVEGVRENMLIGYGLVVGLNGTGDSQPPRNRIDVMALMRIMFAYSPRKNSAKVIDEYSTL